jgi:hypothetical protein
MTPLVHLIAALVFAAGCATPALAQLPPGLPNPDLQNRIPAPLPPPPQPPVINGPLSQGNGPLSQSPSSGVYVPPRLNTFSDRATACLQDGSSFGLRGRKLDRYVRSCAKTN